MAGPSAEDRVVMRRAIAEARNAQPPGIMFALGPAPAERLLDALEVAEAVLREVMEDHPWRDELWYFTDETEAVLAALEVSDEQSG